MAQKNNIRSIRFSDEMAELIDQQVGHTFTQKFENLITKCVWELPMKEAALANLEEQIRRKQNTSDGEPKRNFRSDAQPQPLLAHRSYRLRPDRRKYLPVIYDRRTASVTADAVLLSKTSL